MDINKSIDHFMYELRVNQSQLAVNAGLDISHPKFDQKQPPISEHEDTN